MTASAGTNQGPNASLTVTTSPDGIKVDAQAAIHNEKVPGDSMIDSGKLQVAAVSGSYQLSRKDGNASASAEFVGVGGSMTTSGGPTTGTFNISAANANAGAGRNGVSAGAEATFVKFGSTLSVKIGGATFTVSSQVNVLGAGAKLNVNAGKGFASVGGGATLGLGANLKLDVKW